MKKIIEIFALSSNGFLSLVKSPESMTEKDFKALCAKIYKERIMLGMFETKEGSVKEFTRILIEEHGFVPVTIAGSYPQSLSPFEQI